MTQRERQILNWIEADPMISQQELAERAGITRSSVAVHISNLMKKGCIAGKGYIVTRSPYVTVVGGMNMDIGGWPGEELVAQDSNPGRVRMSPGGVGRNIAHNMSLMGLDVRLLTAFGDDVYAQKLAAVCGELGIEKDFYKTRDIHVHFPEGAVPKDGPSAGVTLTTALVSALSGTPVRRDVAMTGEITLRGKVLAIGGLKEKTMAAYRAGVKTVCIPKENEPDIDELDDVVKNSLKFVVAEDISTVLETALVIPNCNPKEKAPLKRRTTAKAKAEKKLPALTAN